MIAALVLLIDNDNLLTNDDAYLAGIVGLEPDIDTLKNKANESRFSKAPIGKRILVIVLGEASVRSAVTLIKFLLKEPESLDRL